MIHFVRFAPVVLSFTVLSCMSNSTPRTTVSTETNQQERTQNAQEAAAVPDSAAISKASQKVLTAAQNKDFKTLQNMIHPDQGVRFSPYGNINSEKDIHFSKEAFLADAESDKKYTWGFSHGSGDPIALNVKEYFDKYVYDRDFLNADRFAVNRFIAQGNSKNNLSEAYPSGVYSESYTKGTSEMDWKTLRLVFQPKGDQLYLIGVIHDQWTP